MKKLKYVVAKVGDFDHPFVFSELITHSDFVQRHNFSKEEIVGAGFVYIDDYRNFVPYGDSFSLRIGTTPEAIAAFDLMFNPSPLY